MHFLQASAPRELLKPKQLAFDLNDLIANSPDTKPVTCFYAHYLSATKVLRYFNAGHCSPLLVRKNPSDVVRIHQGGLALGSDAAGHYGQGVIQLKTGDRLVAYTRGVVDSWANDEDMDAEGTLIGLVRCWEGEPIAVIADRIVNHPATAGSRKEFQRSRLWRPSKLATCLEEFYVRSKGNSQRRAPSIDGFIGLTAGSL
jgi:serine phosphatase RsbU (regulator of sigma subunit)